MTGDEIYSPSLIAKNYILSVNFVLDLIAALPFDYFRINNGMLFDFLGLASMFKISRVFRIMKIISNLNFT